MNWKQNEANPLADAGFDQESSRSGIVATDSASDQVVYATDDQIIKVTDGPNGLTENELPLPVESEISDIAIGRTSYVYLIADEKLFAFSTSGTTGDPWAENVTQVAAPTESKVVLAKTTDGYIYGYEAQNGLERFGPIEFIDEEHGEHVDPTLVAGRSRFAVYGGSTLRYYDARGKTELETTFKETIRSIGLFPQGAIVSLTNEKIVWISDDGEQNTEIEGCLDAISATGDRLLFGSADDALTVFGDSGIARDIAEAKPSEILQTTDDSLVGVRFEETVHLFSRRDPPTSVSIDEPDEGMALVVAVENPFPILLQLQLQVTDSDGEITERQELFLPPRSENTEEVPLPAASEGKQLHVEIGSTDGTITTFDEQVAVPTDGGRSDHSAEDEGTANGTATPKTDQSTATEEEEEGETKRMGASADENATEHHTESFNETNIGDLSSEPNGKERTVSQTNESIATLVESSERSETQDEEGSERPEQEDGGETEQLGTQDEEASDTVSLSLQPDQVKNSSVEWTIQVENRTDNAIQDVTVEATSPVKFMLTGQTSIDSIAAGNEFVTNASYRYRSGPVTATVQWRDANGNDHERTITHEIPIEILDISARKESIDGNHRLEFTLTNNLDVPIQDQLSIRPLGESQNNPLESHRVVLNPGTNIVTVIPTESNSDVITEDTFQVSLEWLPVKSRVDATPVSATVTSDESNYLIARDICSKAKQLSLGRRSSFKRSQTPTDILVEKVTIRNSSDSWLPSSDLYVQEDSKWVKTGQVIPALRPGDDVELTRYWQTSGDKKEVTVALPEYRIGESGGAVSAEKIETTQSQISACSGFVPLGPEGTKKLFIHIENDHAYPIDLTKIEFKNSSLSKDIDDIKIEKNSHHDIVYESSDLTASDQTPDVVKFTFKYGIQTYTCESIITERLDPPLEQLEWFDASVARSNSEENDTNTFKIKIENKSNKDITGLSLREWNGDGTGANVTVLPPGASISHQQSVALDNTGRIKPEETTVYELSAIVNGEETTEYLEIQTAPEEKGKRYKLTVLPTLGTIDQSALFKSWPEKVASSWYLNIHRKTDGASSSEGNTSEATTTQTTGEN